MLDISAESMPAATSRKSLKKQAWVIPVTEKMHHDGATSDARVPMWCADRRAAAAAINTAKRNGYTARLPSSRPARRASP